MGVIRRGAHCAPAPWVVTHTGVFVRGVLFLFSWVPPRRGAHCAPALCAVRRVHFPFYLGACSQVVFLRLRGAGGQEEEENPGFLPPLVNLPYFPFMTRSARDVEVTVNVCRPLSFVTIWRTIAAPEGVGCWLLCWCCLGSVRARNARPYGMLPPCFARSCNGLHALMFTKMGGCLRG